MEENIDDLKAKILNLQHELHEQKKRMRIMFAKWQACRRELGKPSIKVTNRKLKADLQW
jgi:hypothetical protein